MANLIRYPLRGLIKLFVLHPLGSIAVLVLLAVGTLFLTNNVPEPFRAHADPATILSPEASVAEGNVPAPASTVDFMTGQASFNAEKIWNSLSDEMHSNLLAQGNDKAAIQTQLDQYKQEGRQIEKFTYVGGFASGGPKSFYFYVASIRQPELGGAADQVFFAFTVDREGKIAKVE